MNQRMYIHVCANMHHVPAHMGLHTHISLLPNINSPRAFDFTSFLLKQNFNPPKDRKKKNGTFWAWGKVFST